MKKSKENVMERPVTLKSGVALQSNYSVQHRSDILMEEQEKKSDLIETPEKKSDLIETPIAAVRTGQTDLKKALSDLEVAKTEEEIDKCREVVQATKERSEKAIMVLQVLIKVNTELTFARAELDEALDKQEGDINESRKRVMWLEERMGILCGKARLRGQTYQKPAKSHIFSDRAFHSRMGSSSSTSSSENGFPKHGGFMGRNKSIEIKSITTGRPEMSPSESGSDYPPYQQQNRGLADTPSSGAESYLMAQKQMGGMRGPGMMQGPGMDDSDSESDTGIPPALQGMPAMAGPGVKSPESESESESSGSEYGDETETNVQPPKAYKQMPSEYSGSQVTYSVRYEDEAEQSEDGHGPVTQTEQVETQAHDKEGQQVDDEQEDEEAESERDDDAGTEKEEGMSDREKSEVSERTESPQSSISGVSGEGLHNQQDIKDPTFITEVSFPRSVTIQTPRRDAGRPAHPRDEVHGKGDGADVLTLTQEESQEDLDLARDYWLSEHHRFEYSEHSEVLLELDPVSYHYVGLAMPGSFISRPEKGFVDLPWRSRRKGSDINDVHKTALDKLATRVHTMYDRFYDAALLSVRPSQTMDGRRETTMLSAFDNTRDGARSGTPTDSRPGMVTAPPTTADGMSRPQTVNVVIPPIKLKPGLNVYHPKPIPPPDMLPLTRTSKNKEYPRLADVFTEEDILVHKPAVRIVDQRNLYKETKLKLYRDRPKKEDDGPSTTEKKFRMMLEQEKSMGSKSSRSSRQTTPMSSRSSTAKIREESASSSSFISKTISVMARGPAGTRMSMTRTLTKADTSNRPESETGASTWSRLKPSSRGKEYGGLKWERVKTVVHVNLVSKRADERRDAAKHLGLLRCGDAMVFYALKERLRSDEDARTRYEAAKSLVLLGCWDEDVLQVILKYLVTGNAEVRQDLIQTMTDGKNVGYVNKKIPIFPELVKVLSHFCRSPDPDDTNSFDAAVLLGKLCVADENAKFKLLRSLDQSMDTHVKAKALDVLVKQLNCASWEVVQHLLSLFRESPVWKYRALAADLLIILGKEQVCKRGEEEKIYLILERKLWDDPTKDVRVSAAKALAALGMFSKACDRIEKRLEDTDEDIRAQAVISVGTLEMKNEKIIRLLLEMLELDASEYVRLMICRTFTTLKLTDKRILRALRERDKVEGALARESRKALKVLECLATLPRLTSPTGRRSMASRATPRGTTPRYTPAVTA